MDINNKTSVPRNVLNVEEVEKVLAFKSKMGRYPKHIDKWVNTILKRWILRESPYAKPVMDSKALYSSWFIVTAIASGKTPEALRTKVREETHVVDLADQPEWVAKALAEKQELVFIEKDSVLNAFSEEFDHITDYLRTLPEKDLSMTVDVARKHTKAWDKALSREKLIGSLTDGVLLVESPEFEAYKDPVILVRLVSKQAFKNEGTVMNHCVGSYFDKKDTAVYSIRGADSHKPLATFEIRLGKKGSTSSLVQLRGPHNASVGSDLTALVHSWCEANKINTPQYHEYDEEEDEDEGIEDNEEDDEEAEDDESDEEL